MTQRRPLLEVADSDDRRAVRVGAWDGDRRIYLVKLRKVSYEHRTHGPVVTDLAANTDISTRVQMADLQKFIDAKLGDRIRCELYIYPVTRDDSGAIIKEPAVLRIEEVWS